MTVSGATWLSARADRTRRQAGLRADRSSGKRGQRAGPTGPDALHRATCDSTRFRSSHPHLLGDRVPQLSRSLDDGRLDVAQVCEHAADPAAEAHRRTDQGRFTQERERLDGPRGRQEGEVLVTFGEPGAGWGPRLRMADIAGELPMGPDRHRTARGQLITRDHSGGLVRVERRDPCSEPVDALGVGRTGLRHDRVMPSADVTWWTDRRLDGR